MGRWLPRTSAPRTPRASANACTTICTTPRTARPPRADIPDAARGDVSARVTAETVVVDDDETVAVTAPPPPPASSTTARGIVQAVDQLGGDVHALLSSDERRKVRVALCPAPERVIHADPIASCLLTASVALMIGLCVGFYSQTQPHPHPRHRLPHTPLSSSSCVRGDTVSRQLLSYM